MRRIFCCFCVLFFVLTVITASVFVSQAQAAAKPSAAIGKVKNKYVCLTVDDGWSKTKVTSILNALRKHKVQCTFFIVGQCLKRNPGIWRKAVKDGHEICYHSMSHGNLRRMSNKRIIADIKNWEKTARKVLGKDYHIPKLARLPYGSGNGDKRVLKVFADRGYKVIGWNVDTYSHRRHVVSYIRRTKPGSIILTHFTGYDGTAMKKYLGWLKKKFKLVKLSEALGLAQPPAAEQPTPSAAPG